MKILIILEDPTLDQYIVKPIVAKLLQDVSRIARVEVLRDPHLRGLEQALDRNTLAEIIEDNPMIDLFLLVVDRDCNRFRSEARVAAREREFADRLLGCVAIEEVEVWMLGLCDIKRLPAPWQEIRSHCDPKESFAEPFLTANGWTTEVGHGRKRAMDALSQGGMRRLLSRCQELRSLRDRLSALPPSSPPA